MGHLGRGNLSDLVCALGKSVICGAKIFRKDRKRVMGGGKRETGGGGYAFNVAAKEQMGEEGDPTPHLRPEWGRGSSTGLRDPFCMGSIVCRPRLWMGR